MARRRHKVMTRLGNWLTLLLVVGAIGAATVVYLRWRFREQRYNRLIQEVATQYSVDPFLIKAVMRQESGFDPFALSSKGAVGLMQLMPATGADWARAMGRRNFTRAALWNERNNIEAGAWYLRRGLTYWQAQGITNAVPFTLAEYNAGRGNVLRWLPHGMATTPDELLEAITNPGVRRYVERVTDYYETYRADGKL